MTTISRYAGSCVETRGANVRVVVLLYDISADLASQSAAVPRRAVSNRLMPVHHCQTRESVSSRCCCCCCSGLHAPLHRWQPSPCVCVCRISWYSAPPSRCSSS